jgi:hypothetical protein
MFSDNVPTIAAVAWPADARLFSGDDTGGPVPTFFTEDIEAAREAIAENLVRLHSDIQRLMKLFIMPENIDLQEALAIIKKPRYI